MKKLAVYIITSLIVFGAAGTVFAAGGFGSASSKLDSAVAGVGLERNLGTSIGTIIQGALAIVGTIFLVLMVYAGILWMTASGNEEKVSNAKQIIIAATIGVTIAMMAYAITYYVTGKVGNISTPTTQ